VSVLVASAPVPLRPYPGIKEAFGDLVEAMTAAIREESGSDVTDWVAREMHVATAADIVALVDAATDHVVAGTPLVDRTATVRRLDLLRTEISRRMALEQVRTKDISDEIVGGILGVIALVDADLYEHLDAVGVLSSRIALVMGMDTEFAKTCLNVGRLHDVGKMAIPRAILYKPGRLDADEYDLVKRHADAGHRMVSGIPGVARYAAGVRGHHERLDGSGYPDGLVGEAIPLEARVVAVADVFHAMTSDRCYRAPLEPVVAIKEIIRGRGRLYDAAVVDSALSVFGAHIGALAVA
jgi:HD-GYP domain-containing protein (c-di-GMP phosphodiesterase class II)